MVSETPHIKVAAATVDGMLIEFDRSVYRLSAVKKAAYRFGDRFHVLIGTTADWIRVTLQAKTPLADPVFMAGEFCNEALDQELREQVAEETESVRDLLMAQAFAATSLVDPGGDDGDYRQDPLGIRCSAEPSKGGAREGS